MEYITVPLVIILAMLPIGLIMYMQKIDGEWL